MADHSLVKICTVVYLSDVHEFDPTRSFFVFTLKVRTVVCVWCMVDFILCWLYR